MTSVIVDKSTNPNNGISNNFANTDLHFWAIGAPIIRQDLDMDSVGNNCDVCEGNDASGNEDMDGICNDIDPDYTGCDGDDITEQAVQYDSNTEIRASQTITTFGSVIIPQGVEVNYSAPLSIILNTGFEVEVSGVFQANNEDCLVARQ